MTAGDFDSAETGIAYVRTLGDATDLAQDAMRDTWAELEKLW